MTTQSFKELYTALKCLPISKTLIDLHGAETHIYFHKEEFYLIHQKANSSFIEIYRGYESFYQSKENFQPLHYLPLEENMFIFHSDKSPSKITYCLKRNEVMSYSFHIDGEILPFNSFKLHPTVVSTNHN